jgi:hypothetical protein
MIPFSVEHHLATFAFRARSNFKIRIQRQRPQQQQQQIESISRVVSLSEEGKAFSCETLLMSKHCIALHFISGPRGVPCGLPCEVPCGVSFGVRVLCVCHRRAFSSGIGHALASIVGILSLSGELAMRERSPDLLEMR